MEQALVFASIIIGIAVSDEIVRLNRLLRARAHVAWDWLPLALAGLVLLSVGPIGWLSRSVG